MRAEKDNGEIVANWEAVENYINGADPGSLQLMAIFDLLRLRLLEQAIKSTERKSVKRAKGSVCDGIVRQYKTARLTQLGEQMQERLKGMPGYKTEMEKAYCLLGDSGLKPEKGETDQGQKDLQRLLNLTGGRLKSYWGFDLGFSI